jgi:hypothetical protein
MGFVLNRRLGKLFDVTEVASLGRFALALVPSSLAGWGTSLLFSEVFGVRLESSLSTHLLVAGAIAVVMSATYVAALLVLRDETTKALLAPLRRRGDDRA